MPRCSEATAQITNLIVIAGVLLDASGMSEWREFNATVLGIGMLTMIGLEWESYELLSIPLVRPNDMDP